MPDHHGFHHPGAADAPVVIALHGTGGDEHQFTGLIHQILPTAGIVAPRGDVSEHGANRFFRRTGEGVYDMADLAIRTTRMLGLVARARADHPGRPIIGLGYSNGANILAAMLFQDPAVFDRAALLHPLIPWEPTPQPALRGLPVLITAGQSDPICPLPLSHRLIDWFTAQGADVTPVIAPGGHEIRPAELAALNLFFNAA